MYPVGNDFNYIKDKKMEKQFQFNKVIIQIMLSPLKKIS